MKTKQKTIVAFSMLSVLLVGTIFFVLTISANYNDFSNTLNFEKEDSEYFDFDDNLNEDETAEIFETDLTTDEIYNYIDYDIDIEISDSEISYIYLDNEEIEADDSVKVEGSVAYITSSGTYSISGTLTNGQIVVNAEDKTVKIILNNVDITSSTNSPILIEEAKEVLIEIAEGTTNYITDNGFYEDPDNFEDATTAAILSRDDLYISGEGKLIINSEKKNGIQSKDQIVITGGNITINAAKEAIKAKDYIVIDNGNLDLTAGEDGIAVTEDEDIEKGWIEINGGTIKVQAQLDGISAKTYLIINNGDLDITTKSTSADKSAKALKSDYYLEINGGSINLNSVEDGIHSNNQIIINDGTITISAGDDGIHADELVEINDGTITIGKSVEGIEAKNIYINDGDISITSSDDGINVADSSTDSREGMMMAISGAGLYISNGNLYVNANGDGLDSNGDMTITGGYIIVDGPTNSANGGLDCNGELTVDGGYLIVVGSSGMAEAPEQNSEQNSVLVFFSSTLSAGTELTIKDSKGNEIMNFESAKTFASLVFSSEDLKTGDTYEVYVDGNSYTEFTVSSATTTVGTQTNNMQGGMPNGMMRPPGRF